MDSSPGDRRIRATLSFIAELESLAAECVGARPWADELTTRRRQRGLVEPEIRSEERQVKAL